MTTVAQVAERVNFLLKEHGIAEADRKWRDDEFVLWARDGQLEIVRASPGSAATTATLTLATGCQQTIGSPYYRILRLNGKRPVSRDILDAILPDWEDATAEADFDEYVQSEDLQTFYVTPPLSGAVTVKGSFDKNPAELDDVNDAIVVRDEFIPALTMYMAHRAMQQQADYAVLGMAGAFMNEFVAMMGAAK